MKLQKPTKVTSFKATSRKEQSIAKAKASQFYARPVIMRHVTARGLRCTFGFSERI